MDGRSGVPAMVFPVAAAAALGAAAISSMATAIHDTQRQNRRRADPPRNGTTDRDAPPSTRGDRVADIRPCRVAHACLAARPALDALVRAAGRRACVIARRSRRRNSSFRCAIVARSRRRASRRGIRPTAAVLLQLARSEMSRASFQRPRTPARFIVANGLANGRGCSHSTTAAESGRGVRRGCQRAENRRDLVRTSDRWISRR